MAFIPLTVYCFNCWLDKEPGYGEYLAGFIQLDPDTSQDSQGLATAQTLELFSLSSFFTIYKGRNAPFEH